MGLLDGRKFGIWVFCGVPASIARFKASWSHWKSLRRFEPCKARPSLACFCGPMVIFLGHLCVTIPGLLVRCVLFSLIVSFFLSRGWRKTEGPSSPALLPPPILFGEVRNGKLVASLSLSHSLSPIMIVILPMHEQFFPKTIWLSPFLIATGGQQLCCCLGSHCHR